MKTHANTLAFREGSSTHARELAKCMNANLNGLGATDAALAGAALRSFGSRGIRRAGAALVAVGMVGSIALVGVADRNHDGRVDLADAVHGIRAALVAMATPD